MAPRFSEYSPGSKPRAITQSSGPTLRQSFIASSLPPKEMYPNPYGFSAETALAPFTDQTVGACSRLEKLVVIAWMPGQRAASLPT